MRIVGLVGRAGSGKDYMASILQRALRYTPLALADALKVKCVVERGVPLEHFYGDNRPSTARDILQRVGTDEVREQFDEDYWWKTLDAWMSVLAMRLGTASFVVPDVRFLNEAQWIWERKGIVIRLTGRGRAVTVEQNTHRSEMESDRVAADVDIANGPDQSREIRPGECIAQAEWKMLEAVTRHFAPDCFSPDNSKLLALALDSAQAQRDEMAGR